MNCLITVREEKTLFYFVNILIGILYTNRESYKVMSFVKNVGRKKIRGIHDSALLKTKTIIQSVYIGTESY